MMSELSPEGAGDRRWMGNHDDGGDNMTMIQSTVNDYNLCCLNLSPRRSSPSPPPQTPWRQDEPRSL